MQVTIHLVASSINVWAMAPMCSILGQHPMGLGNTRSLQFHIYAPSYSHKSLILEAYTVLHHFYMLWVASHDPWIFNQMSKQNVIIMHDFLSKRINIYVMEILLMFNQMSKQNVINNHASIGLCHGCNFLHFVFADLAKGKLSPQWRCNNLSLSVLLLAS